MAGKAPCTQTSQKLVPQVRNDIVTRAGIQEHSLALTRCPLCNNLQLQKGTIGGAKACYIKCKCCGNLQPHQQDVARLRQRRVIQAILAPDINKACDADESECDKGERHTKKPTTVRSINVTAPHERRNPPLPTSRHMAMTDVEASKGDLTMQGVPKYDDETVDEQDVSVKEMLMAMRSQFRGFGKKVSSLEKTPGATQNNLQELADKVEDVASK